jgi:hypothetical protein
MTTGILTHIESTICSARVSPAAIDRQRPAVEKKPLTRSQSMANIPLRKRLRNRFDGYRAQP